MQVLIMMMRMIGHSDYLLIIKSSPQAKFGNDEKESDVILHGYIKKLVSWIHHTFHKYWAFEKGGFKMAFQGGPFESTWHSRYAKLYPNR